MPFWIIKNKGTDNLSIPFAQLLISGTQFVNVVFDVHGIREYRNNVFNDKPPLIFM